MVTNTNLIQWRDQQDLSKGFILDLENGSASEVFQGIYLKPHTLISAFEDCFLIIGFNREESNKMAHDLYHQSRNQLDAIIRRCQSIPYVQTPTNNNVLQ